jgi:hypothetical protein
MAACMSRLGGSDWVYGTAAGQARDIEVTSQTTLETLAEALQVDERARAVAPDVLAVLHTEVCAMTNERVVVCTRH